MSSNKSKKHGKSKKKNEDEKPNTKPEKEGESNSISSEIPITFKYAGRFATMTKTIMIRDKLPLEEIEKLIPVQEGPPQPPDAKGVFEVFYESEIAPKIGRSAQESMSSKKAVSASWEFQTDHFQCIYEKRAALLLSKWEELTLGKGQSVSYAVQSHHHHQDPNREMERTVIFKYYSVHSSAKTNRHIHFSRLSKQQILDKIKLSVDHPPPSGVDVFCIFYYDEVLSTCLRV